MFVPFCFFEPSQKVMPIEEFERDNDEETEEELQLRKKRKPVSVRSLLAWIPIVGWIANWIIGFFMRKIAEVYVTKPFRIHRMFV